MNLLRSGCKSEGTELTKHSALLRGGDKKSKDCQKMCVVRRRPPQAHPGNRQAWPRMGLSSVSGCPCYFLGGIFFTGENSNNFEFRSLKLWEKPLEEVKNFVLTTETFIWRGWSFWAWLLFCLGNAVRNFHYLNNMLHACIPTLNGLKQQDCFRFWDSLDFTEMLD